MRLQVKDIYQILKEENSLRSITLDEVKSLIKYVKDKSDNPFASETMVGDKTPLDEVNVYDLVNAVMDVSLDVIGMLNNQNNNSNTRYSHEYSANKQQQQNT